MTEPKLTHKERNERLRELWGRTTCHECMQSVNVNTDLTLAAHDCVRPYGPRTESVSDRFHRHLRNHGLMMASPLDGQSRRFRTDAELAARKSQTTK